MEPKELTGPDVEAWRLITLWEHSQELAMRVATDEAEGVVFLNDCENMKGCDRLIPTFRPSGFNPAPTMATAEESITSAEGKAPEDGYPTEGLHSAWDYGPVGRQRSACGCQRLARPRQLIPDQRRLQRKGLGRWG